MFERYTESARRVLSFSLSEARERGSMFIQPDHLLLGVVHAADDITSRIFRNAGLSLDTVRSGMPEPKSPLPTSVQIPFHSETKRVLQYAAEEADRLLHRALLAHIADVDDHIGPEHLLLGLLREDTAAAATLTRHGVTLELARREVVGHGP